MVDPNTSLGTESLLLLAALAVAAPAYALMIRRRARRRPVERRLAALRPLVEPWLAAHR